MRILLPIIISAGLLAGCTTDQATTPTSDKKPETKTQPQKAEKATFQRSRSAAIARYKSIYPRILPTGKRVCKAKHPTASPKFCDFQVQLIDNPKQPPNAFQTVGKDGRPIVAFNINMLRTVKNDNEIAFILGHEFGHQIANHLTRTRSNATAGAVLGAVLVGALGGNPNIGADLGGTIGARAYSKNYELQADTIGAHIASRAGYNARVGAQSFNRTGGSDAFLATHPPGPSRISNVNRTMDIIDAAKAQGKTAPVVW